MTWRDLKSCKVELVAVCTVLVVLGLIEKSGKPREGTVSTTCDDAHVSRGFMHDACLMEAFVYS